MATNLVTLIASETTAQNALEQDISRGAAAQIKLAQVNALVDELSAAGQRLQQLTAGAEKRLADAKTRAAEVTAGFTPIDTFLASLPTGAKVADLNTLVGKDLAAPPDAAKPKYDDYVSALRTADQAVVAAATAITLAQDLSARTAVDVTRAEEALERAVNQAARLAEDASAALDEASRARSAKDLARAYAAERRAKALVDLVNAAATTNAVTDAEKVLRDSVDAHADAVARRLAAEAAATKAQSDRSKAADLLGTAGALVLAAVNAKIAAP